MEDLGVIVQALTRLSSAVFAATGQVKTALKHIKSSVDESAHAEIDSIVEQVNNITKAVQDIVPPAGIPLQQLQVIETSDGLNNSPAIVSVNTPVANPAPTEAAVPDAAASAADPTVNPTPADTVVPAADTSVQPQPESPTAY